MCFCCGFTQFHFYYGHSHGRIWNPPLRSANPVAFCLLPTSAGWGHPALHPTENGERRAASPLAAVPACAVLHHPGNRTTYPGHAAGHRPADNASLGKGRCRACEAEGFLPVRGCDSAQGTARRNPSVRLRRPPPFDKGGRTVKKGAFTLGPLCEGAPPAGGGGENCTITRNISGYGKVLSLRPFGAPPAQREAFLRPTLNFTSNFTLAKYGKVCYNLIAYRFSGKYSRNAQ